LWVISSVAAKIQMMENGNSLQWALPNHEPTARDVPGLCALTEPEPESSATEGSKKQRMENFTFNALSAEASGMEQPRRAQ
jgi:hypothetical protein